MGSCIHGLRHAAVLTLFYFRFYQMTFNLSLAVNRTPSEGHKATREHQGRIARMPVYGRNVYAERNLLSPKSDKQSKQQIYRHRPEVTVKCEHWKTRERDNKKSVFILS